MKTTLDLPEALVKQVKHLAVRDGRKLKEAVADLLWKGLALSANTAAAVAPVIRKDRQTGLPLIECPHDATVPVEATPERVADILLGQETDWYHAAGG